MSHQENSKAAPAPGLPRAQEQSQALAPPFPVFRECREWIKIILKPFIMELFNTLFITELNPTFDNLEQTSGILERLETEVKINQTEMPFAFFVVGKQHFSEN